MTMTLDNVEALVPDFQYVDTAHNRIVLTVGLKATFYFWMGHLPEVRARIVECANAYETAYGQHLNWGFHPDLSKRVTNADGALPPLSQHVSTLDQDDSIEWYVSSSTDDKAAGDYKLEILTERGWQEGVMSTFGFTLPRDHAYDEVKKKQFLELFNFCADRLKPFHGHAGLAAVSSYDHEEWQREELDVATRYLGLYIEATFIDPTPAPHGLKSIDWLTFVGNTLAERVGGAHRLKAACSTLGLESTDLSYGLLITTGVAPDLAPIEAGQPNTLVKLNAALRPLRNGAFGSMAFGSVNGEPRFNRCTSDLWIRRFDKPGIWPPAKFIGLGKLPLGISPSKKLRVKTGETCTVYGRYQRPDADKPELVLMPGDVAPYWLQLGAHGEYLGRQSVSWELVAEL